MSREQLVLYQEYAPSFEGLRAGVIGIWSHAAFARDAGIRFPLLEDSHPKGAVARAYGVYLEREELSSRALFVIDERETIRWSRVYPTPVNPGVDGVLCALEAMDCAGSTTLRQEDEGEQM